MDKYVDQLSQLLLGKEMTLVTAESCTGGMIAAAMTSRPGSSSVFERGYITYSNDSKMELLNVSPNILNHYGAVSASCADAMVMGALEKSKADIAVSVTGIAGPDGGSAEKPVGLVYIGVRIMGKEPEVTECYFEGSRDDIRNATCEKALLLLIETVLAI